MRGSRHPAVQRGNGHAEILGHVARRHAAGEQFLGRLYLAVGHLALASTLPAELTRDFQPGARALDGQFTLHLGQARHDVEEEAVRRGAGADGVGHAFELHALLVQLADQIDQLFPKKTIKSHAFAQA